MEKKTGIMFCACALSCAAILLWIAGGYAVASEAVYPIEKSASWFKRNISCRVRTLWKRQSYAAENARLRRENGILRMVVAEFERTAKAEAKPLPSILKGWICAPVLSVDGSTGAKNFLRIGKGSLAGVTKGAAVASPDGLVGIVSDVSLHTCTVKMITDPAVKVSCEIETGDPDIGAVYGIVSGAGARTVAETKAVILYAVNPLHIGHLKNGFEPPPVHQPSATPFFSRSETRQFGERIRTSAVAAAQFPYSSVLKAQFAKAPFIPPVTGAVDQIGHIHYLLGPVVPIGPFLRLDPATVRDCSDVGENGVGKPGMAGISVIVEKDVEELGAVGFHRAAPEIKSTEPQQSSAERSVHQRIKFTLEIHIRRLGSGRGEGAAHDDTGKRSRQRLPMPLVTPIGHKKTLRAVNTTGFFRSLHILPHVLNPAAERTP